MATRRLVSTFHVSKFARNEEQQRLADESKLRSAFETRSRRAMQMGKDLSGIDGIICRAYFQLPKSRMILSSWETASYVSLNLERSSLRHLGNLHTINLDHCCHPQRPVFVGVTTGSRLNGEYLAEIHDRSLRSCIQVAAGRILTKTRIDLIRYILSVLSSKQYIQFESGRSTPARLPANDDLFFANRYPHGVLYPWKT